MEIKKDMYEGFSLIEMILTIFILGVVMVICATTLTTLIKVSMMSEGKNSARNDINFILEVVNRSLSSANLQDIRMYQSSGIRRYDPETNQVITINEGAVATTYANSTDSDATEVHVRSYGFDRWTCIGAFEGNGSSLGQWFVVKTSVSSLDDAQHGNCFGSSGNDYLIVLNSTDVNIAKFVINKISVADINSFLTVDITGSPIHWPAKESNSISPEVSKQITVSTQGLTWYY